MDYKKILMGIVIMVFIISAANVVNAGLFGIDDVSQDTSDNESNTDWQLFPALLTDSNVNYNINDIYTIKHVKNESFEGQVAEKNEDVSNMTFDGYITLDLSANSAESIKELEQYLNESQYNVSGSPADDSELWFETSDCNYTLENNILTITFKGETTVYSEDLNDTQESGSVTLDYNYVSVNFNSSDIHISIVDEQDFEMYKDDLENEQD